MTKGILILGATSPIARALAEQFAAQEYDLFLAGRDEDELARLKSDLSLRFAVNVYSGFFDAEKISQHASFLSEVTEVLGQLEGVVMAFGYMGQGQEWLHDSEDVKRIIDCNMTGACSILTQVATALEVKRHGFIVALSSVAGDRGRQVNYVYGAAKSGLNVFLQGLRSRLFKSGVHVLTVKPGFVDTSMTFGKSGVFAVASPHYVAKVILNALLRRRNEIYVPWFWWWIMSIIAIIPETLFKRLKF